MTARTTEDGAEVIGYDVAQLFVDQGLDWVADTIAPLVAWVPRGKRELARQPFRFPVEHTTGAVVRKLAIELTWSDAELMAAIPGVLDHARRLREGRSAEREHVTEMAAYALALVAMSVLLPGRRIKKWNMYVAPDILFDLAPDALRGVEVAGRDRGGRAALLRIRDGDKGKPGKRGELVARSDIAEVHISLWSGSARLGMMEQVKP